MSGAGNTTEKVPSLKRTVFEGLDDEQLAYFAEDLQELKQFMEQRGVTDDMEVRSFLWLKLEKWREARHPESSQKRAAGNATEEAPILKGTVFEGTSHWQLAYFAEDRKMFDKFMEQKGVNDSIVRALLWAKLTKWREDRQQESSQKRAAGNTADEVAILKGTVFEGMDDGQLAYFAEDRKMFDKFMEQKGVNDWKVRALLWAKLTKWREARHPESSQKRAAGNTADEVAILKGTVFEGMDDGQLAYFVQDQQEFTAFVKGKGINNVGDRARLRAKLVKWREAQQPESRKRKGRWQHQFGSSYF